jgi:hypothetical protein
MPLEGFPIVKPTCPDNKFEIPMLGESLLKTSVHIFPAAPMIRSCPVEMGGKTAEFKHELAEDGRCDRRNHSREQTEGEGGDLREHDAESQPAESRNL